MHILDLGGNNGAFGELLRSAKLQITVADILDFEDEVTARGFRFVQLKEGQPLPFSDREFDVVLCNSVIEHVTLPKGECSSVDIDEPNWKNRSFAQQRAFANEIRRVGTGYFVQTPHRNFPFDLHLWLPFTNWLSHRAVLRIARYTDVLWIKKTGGPDWHLLSPYDLSLLFPEGEIVVERFLGLPKSIIALKPPEPRLRS